jgi:NAD(P)H-flavin reductase/cytochrome b involved in lipid metabolism
MGKALISIGFILAAALFGILEIVQVFWWNKITVAKKNLPEYTHLQVMDMINDGKLLMFADELVVDVGHFIFSHPGGSYMVKESIGEDTGKYMVGCSSYGADLNPYAHSEKAFSMLKTLAIGRIKTPEGYFSSTDSKDHVFIKFSMIKQVKLNEHTSVIYFSHPNFKMSNICNSPEWLGKHFMISYRKKIGLKKRIGYVKRYYSSLFVDLFQWEKELNILSKREEISDDGLVKFIYKVYPGGKMTNHLSSLSENESVLLRGPLGPGLLMSSLNGNYLALGGGTGLVPFLDLVYMAWKAYGSKTDKFRLRLFAFFRTSKDGFAIEILHKMAESCPWLQFRLVSDEDPNKKNIREDIRAEAKEGFDLAWICGPSGFNRSYNNLLIDNGIVKSKIVLL